MIIEKEIGVMWLQAKGTKECPHHVKPKEARNRFHPQSFWKKHSPPDTLISDF